MGLAMRAAQYYLHIAVPAVLSRRVSAIGRRYGSDARSAPHITLVIPRTLAKGRRERDLVRALRDAVGPLDAFPIDYAGVSYFGDRDFIYVAVDRTRALVRCQRACTRAVAGRLDPSDRHVTFARPHITLAGRLSPERASAAWQALHRRHFAGRFICREVLLWRRRAGEARWQLVSRLTLARPRAARSRRSSGAGG